VGRRVALAHEVEPEQVQPAFDAGLKMLVGRGLVIRLVSWSTTLAILRLVVPADLGVLVVIQALFGVTGLVAEWGYTSYLIRRRVGPGTPELAAFASVQLAVALFVVVAIVVAPGSLFDAWLGLRGGKALLVIIAIGAVFTYGQNGSKAVLEREMNFAVLARIDVASVSAQNVLLLIAALLGRFVDGIPVSMVAADLLATTMFAIHVPRAWRLTYDIRPLALGIKGATPFAANGLADTVNRSLLPLAISTFFGLAILGSWSVATRLGQISLVVFESFWRAGLPAASRLAHERVMLDRLTQSSFRRALRLSTPIALVIVVGAPLTTLLFPLWTSAIVAAQVWSVAYAATGSVTAVLSPRQVALTGPRMLVIATLSASAATLALLALLSHWQSPIAVAIAFAGGAIAGVIVWFVSAGGPMARALIADAGLEGGTLVVVGVAVLLGSWWGNSGPAIIAAAISIMVVVIVRRPRISRPAWPRRGAAKAAKER
jgi:O-antigen/teichoic acid export membrane protein